MIFEGDDVTKLVLIWQNTHDPEIMEQILEQSTSLIEVIVSKQDQMYREDLIQESKLKLHYACDFYSPGISSLHNFFTTVIHNVCSTFVIKQEREYLLDDASDNGDGKDAVELPDMTTGAPEEVQSDLLPDLICYMRTRFPSLPASVLDECSEIMYYGLTNGEQTKIMMSEITRTTLSRYMATLIYNVAVAYLRLKNLSCATVDVDSVKEYSLLPELKLVAGEVVYSKLLAAFAGMTIRFPQ